jgi:hypothetical protein
MYKKSSIFILFSILMLDGLLHARVPYGNYVNGYSLKKRDSYGKYSIELNVEQNSYFSKFKYGGSDSTLISTEKNFGMTQESMDSVGEENLGDKLNKLSITPRVTLNLRRHTFSFTLETYSITNIALIDEEIKFANRAFPADTQLTNNLSFGKYSFGYRYYMDPMTKIGLNSTILNYKISLEDPSSGIKEYAHITQMYPTFALDLKYPIIRKWFELYANFQYNTSGNQTNDLGMRYTNRRNRSFLHIGYKRNTLGLKGNDLEIDTNYSGYYIGYGRFF